MQAQSCASGLLPPISARAPSAPPAAMAQPALACVVDPDPLKAASSRYTKIATLGQGSFGFVQLCKGRDASGREEYAAIKVRHAARGERCAPVQ